MLCWFWSGLNQAEPHVRWPKSWPLLKESPRTMMAGLLHMGYSQIWVYSGQRKPKYSPLGVLRICLLMKPLRKRSSTYSKTWHRCYHAAGFKSIRKVILGDNADQVSKTKFELKIPGFSTGLGPKAPTQQQYKTESCPSSHWTSVEKELMAVITERSANVISAKVEMTSKQTTRSY